MKQLLLTSAVTFAALNMTTPTMAQEQSLIVAGGCFWCVESDFESIEGVTDVVSGYIGGHVANPTYQQVSSKKTGHYEAVKITFDDDVVSLRELTDYFWLTIDPTDATGQFCDKGDPYRTGLFYQNAQQHDVFKASLASTAKNKPFDADIVTEILPASTFYLAEDYHQDYYLKNNLRYKFYRFNCGRDARIEELWGSVASKQSQK
ncbi:peptide-methionine (S)-S-oxide reductase MsrA [Marinomonas ostreistagni]|uniref:Peptide methionine sulfoxide reductase MsrA n=1 Tax=Marinomonas ostreistagni TaxID=359209 RepID=A0ABS0Z8X6_9GAMM|nr:peptide-methionine (S)-S-oxide reductase MsrA [Marinomonas ostreistagni]MBJ7550096.1 peptide-methionine (S)-S-oxide reductase MsrA [Marinomonas ostreistagni]